MFDILLDSLIDCLKLLPFLFLSYLAVEYAEHHMNGRIRTWIYRAGKAGPLFGSLIGIIPQCGFSAAAAGLFAAGMVSPGTLLAVFLSTSDEMLPIMVSEGVAAGKIAQILLIKVVVGTLAGLLADAAAERLHLRSDRAPEHPQMCADGHCDCEHHGIVHSALYHTAHVTVFLFLVSLVLGFCVEWFGHQGLSDFLGQMHGLESLLSALIGMIPNCAASVLITQLYLEGVLGAGAMLAGLLCGAGTGLLVLFRENHSIKENLVLTAALYGTGAAAGLLLSLVGFAL